MEVVEKERNAQIMQERRICVIVPVYNCESTVGRVLHKTLELCHEVIVVDDGSTDGTPEVLKEYSDKITLVTHKKNKGKGAALKTGLSLARKSGFAYAITIDSDGQHYPSDIPTLVEENIGHPDRIIVGRRQDSTRKRRGSIFANKFANFWFAVQTWRHLHDTQSGFRLYPLRHLPIWAMTRRYEAELILLVLSYWNGVHVREVNVDVYYPPKDKQTSHFRPVRDFARISVLNTFLCVFAVIYGLPLKIFRMLRDFLGNVYKLTVFLLFVFFVVKPFTWIYTLTHKKHQHGQKHTLHNFIYKTARFVMMKHGIPGIKFSNKVSDDVDFSKPSIIICNHQSALDLFCALVFTPKIVFLVNDRVWKNPFYGKLIRKAGYLQASQGLRALMPQIKARIAHGYSVAIFPEGTRSVNGKIGRFHRGAFQIAATLGVDIIPLFLYGAGRAFPKGAFYIRRAQIYIEAGSPITQEQLSHCQNFMEQASYVRKLYKERSAAISNRIDIENHSIKKVK